MVKPFIKILWEDTPENFTKEKIRRVRSYFEEKYGTKNIKLITKSSVTVENTRFSTLNVTDNITDYGYQNKLMKEFIIENKIDVDLDKIERLDNKVNEEIDKNSTTTKSKYNKWYIKSIEFSNFLSFGNKNLLNFDELDGLTVVESVPKNFGGKSTMTIDLFLFLFFNKTSKTKVNADIFNKFSNENTVYVKGEIIIDGVEYYIERILERKEARNGEYKVTSTLNFYKNEHGETVNLTGEQRRETENFISNVIGTEEDFLSTILSTGHNLEELIESKPTARGQILTKFIGLENLRVKEEAARGIYNAWSRKLVSNTYNKIELLQQNENYDKTINESKVEIEKLKVKLLEYDVELNLLEKEKEDLIGKKNNDIDLELIKINPQTLEREINDLMLSRDRLIIENNNVLLVEPSSYYNEDEHTALKETINEKILNSRLLDEKIKRSNKLLLDFEKGLICPTCNRPFDNEDHTSEKDQIKKEIADVSEKLELITKEIAELKKQEEAYLLLKKEFDSYEKNKLIKAKHELDIEQKENLIVRKKELISKYESIEKKLEENKAIDNKIIMVRSKVDTLKGTIRITDSSINEHNKTITILTEKIKTNIELIKKIEFEDDYAKIFTIYLNIFGKNGISKSIMKSIIPLINDELYNLLIDSCHFILELNINEKNEVEFIMIDIETRICKLLEAGSGYEKTISSLALRSVLTKISSLPKPNIVIMDEVFGKIADENLEMVGKFFTKIKNYFDHIMVISHNPLIRNWADNLIIVKKDDNISYIENISKSNQ